MVERNTDLNDMIMETRHHHLTCQSEGTNVTGPHPLDEELQQAMGAEGRRISLLWG